MAHVSVIPENISPAPINPGRAAQKGCPQTASADPMTTSDPVMICTWQLSGMDFLPRTTGIPADSQAMVPLQH